MLLLLFPQSETVSIFYARWHDNTSQGPSRINNVQTAGIRDSQRQESERAQLLLTRRLVLQSFITDVYLRLCLMGIATWFPWMYMQYFKKCNKMWSSVTLLHNLCCCVHSRKLITIMSASFMSPCIKKLLGPAHTKIILLILILLWGLFDDFLIKLSCACAFN